MTPDEQPQPVAWRKWNDLSDDWEITQEVCWSQEYPGWEPLYAHPPTSAASQPDAVRVTITPAMVAAAKAIYDDDVWTVSENVVREMLEAALNPPAESSARGDVK